MGLINWRNYLITALLVASTVAGLSGQHISVGGGVAYNATLSSLGINLRTYYNVGEKICFGPEIAFFLPITESEQGISEKIFLWEANLNIHYIFELSHRVGIYPVIGLNYSHERKRLQNQPSHNMSEIEEAVGGNLGGGAHLAGRYFVTFLEYEYVTHRFKDNVLTAGIFFTLGKVNDE